MPFRYSDTRPELRAEIIERVACGETVKAICAADGMPCAESVTGWARREPAFGAALAEAYRAAALRRGAARTMFDPHVAAEILERRRGGEGIHAILREPGMPSYRVYMRWRREDAGGFGAAVSAWTASQEPERLRGLKARYRAFDREVAERVYARVWVGGRLRDVLRADPALPSLAVLERWRREHPDFDDLLRSGMRRSMMARRHSGRGCTPEMTAAVYEAIAVGGSLRSIGMDPDMPSARAMYNWVRQDAAFREAVADACEVRALWFHGEMEAVAEAAGPGTVRQARARIGKLSAQETRLRKRPGWKARRAADAAGG